MGEIGAALRVLASPGAVLALVVLALNDHVLKQAWPGWVTGKLSDVAGLVVAPLLLSALLTAARVHRPMPVSVAATGAGFVLCKTSAAGAALTSSVWGIFGTPTMIRADVTDLIALPALYVAWRIHRRATAASSTGWRRTAAVAIGMAVLPVGVLVTSATSCDEPEGYQSVGVVRGEFTGAPPGVETRLAVGELMGARFTIDSTGAFKETPFTLADGALSRTARTCLEDRCWRLVGDDAVDSSTDGGRTWVRETQLSDADHEDIREEVGTEDGCDGEAPAVGTTDIAAMEVDGGDLVMATLQRGGVWQRGVDGSWTVLTEDELRDLIVVDRPPVPVVTEVDGSDDPDQPGGAPDPESPPTPACVSPSLRTVTPNPSNGPPTTYEVCPTSR